MKQTFKKLLVAALVLCTFVGFLPMIAMDNTAQAAAATVYYDFRKGNNGYPNAAADKRTAFAALTYDEVAARNTTITSGPWAYHSYSATPDSSAASSDQTNFTSGSFFYYHYDKTKGFTMLTGSRQGVLTAGIKFKGMNAGKYVPYLNINGSYLRTYSGTLTAKIYPLNSSTAIVTKEICLSDYPEDDSYVQLSNAVSFSASEYVLELTINNERTITIINGLQLVAADSIIVTGLYPTNDLGVYEVKVGQTINVPFTQVFSDGTVTTNKLSGWGYTTNNSYVTAGVNSSSRYFTLKGVAETSTPQTVYFSVGNAKVKLNVIVRASSYTATQSDVVYNFKKARPINWSANHVHNFGKHIKYTHTAVGGYGEINTAISSAPWKVSSIASTSEFSTLYDGYGIEHRGNGVTDLKIQVPAGGLYVPQLQVYTTEGVKSDVTVSILTTGGSTVCTKTIPAGTKTEYVNLSTSGVNLSATEYIVRFNKPSTGSSMQAGANYYDGIRLLKSNTTTVTLDPNGGVAGTKTSVTATYGLPMPGVDADGYLPTRTGYRFGGYYDGKNGVVGSGTQYYTMAGKSNHTWDKTGTTATLYASWNVNAYSVKYNANGGSGTMSNSSHTYDKAANLTANAFTREGYTFLGWSTNKNATSATYTDKASVKNLSTTNGDTVNLYAVWKANTYTVTLDGQSATTAGTATVTATYGSEMPSITVPAKTGYTFGGYYTEKNGSGTQYYTSSGASAKNWDKTAATTLYAKWTAKTSTVTLSAADATTAGTASVTATYGSALTAITAPKRTGYTFNGYFDAASGGTKYYNADGTSAKNWDKTAATTLYAQWTANKYTVTLSEGGTVTATYGSAMPATTVPKKAGKVFAGYYDGEGGTGTQYYTSTGASARTWNKAANTTLYAKWNNATVTLNDIGNKSIKGSSTLSFTISGTTNSGMGVTYSVSGLPEGATSGKDGVDVLNATTGVFTWKTTTSDIGDHTITFTATDGGVSTTKTITVTVTRPVTTVTLSEGGTVQGTYGEKLPAIEVPKKAGKVFDGYYKEADGTGSKYYNADGTPGVTWNRAVENVTIYAKWVDATVTFSSISNQSVSALSKLGFTAKATTNSGMSLTYSSANLPTGATISSAGEFSWTPTLDQIGTHNITITATDGDVSASTTVKVTVGAPTSEIVFTAPSQTEFINTAGGIRQFNTKATSSLGLPVTYSAANLPNGATFDNATGKFYWQTTLTDIGVHYVTITATDGYDSAEITIKITVAAPKPTVTFSEGGTVTAIYGKAMPEITVPEKTGYVFAGYFDGENGTGTQYYKADGTSARSWDKTEDTTLYAKWIQGEVTITPIGDKTIAVEEELTFNVKASSTAPGNITYTTENLPEGASFNTNTGAFSWTPEMSQVGEYTIIFKGSDGVNYAEVTVKVVVNNITTTVNFNEGNGSITVEFGGVLPDVAAPEKNGFMFGGYFDGEDGTGTKYYDATGKAVKTWDKKDNTVTLYAYWIEGSDIFGTKIAGINNIEVIDEETGEKKYKIILMAGIDSLDYKEVGFEVTVQGETQTPSTREVYSALKFGNTTIRPFDFGAKCNYTYAQSITFSADKKKEQVVFRPYAIDRDGNKIYGKQVTMEEIYTILTNGGDITIGGEIEIA